MFDKGQWIWYETSAKADSYGEFYDSFSFEGQQVTLSVSCDSNYAAYINGKLAAFGQYADFEHYKVADSVDVTASCKKGKNHLAIIVWHYQEASSAYSPQKAGLLYELRSASDILAYSATATLCRESHVYRIGQKKLITGQMGFSFEYDANKEDGWMTGSLTDFSAAVPIDKTMDLHLRPNKKLTLEDRCPSALMVCESVSEYRYLFDLTREEVGFLDLEVSSDTAQPLTIAYSEHLIEGTTKVPRIIGGRDFSVVYHTKPGKNSYMNPFRRLGARYLEICCKYPITVAYAGIRPTMYPLTRTSFAPKSDLDRRIYEICVRTLELCLHEHYEDCPWREQCFYAMDSRNQMLCGYIAFHEFEAVRAGLSRFGQDRHESGFLSICCPNASDAHLFIPSFSLHYFTAVDEYTRYSKDTTLALEVYDKLTSLLKNFAANKKDGLLTCLSGKAWNFYEWRPMLDGSLESVLTQTPKEAPNVDIILNALYCLALTHMAAIADAIGYDSAPYTQEASEIRDAIRSAFYRPDTGLFSTFIEVEHYSETANALSILCGAAADDTALFIAEQMTVNPDRFVPASLSMKCFPYDALLMADREKYGPWVLDQIRYRYKIMLDAGSTTVWEDEEGAAAFDNAGSLCHGWSSIPIYYCYILQDLL